jgi:hypothetical protein
MKLDLKEPLMDEESEDYQYDGGDKKKKTKTKGEKKAKGEAGDADDDKEIGCEDIIPGGNKGVRLLGVLAILCIGIFFLSYFMRSNKKTDACVAGETL